MKCTFSHFSIFSQFWNAFFHMFSSAFSIFFRCLSHFFRHMWKIWKKHLENAFEKNVKKCIWKPSWENCTLIFFIRFLMFLVRDLLQSLQSFFAACQISAGWKSKRSSSNRSEVACADRRVGRLQWIKAWKMF